MPTGSFYSDPAVPRGSSGTSTGTAAPSVPRGTLTGGDYGTAPAMPRTGATAGGSGYTSTFGEIRIGTPATGQETGLYGLPGQNPNTEPSPTNLARTNLLGAQQLAQTMYGPQQQLLADQLARQQSSLGMIGVNADYKTSALNRDNALALQSLGLDRAGIGIDQNLTKTQLANLEKLRGLLGQRYGLAGDTLTNQLKGFGIDKTQAADMARRQRFDLRSQLTARGAFNTVANERGTGRINRDLMYQLGQIGVGEQGARLSYKGNIIGLNEQGIGYDNQAAGLNARLANLGLDTQRLGISEQQLANSLQDGLHQIGMDSMISLNGLLDAIGGTNMQQAQLAGTILQEIMGYANLPPDVLAQMTALLSGTSGGTTTRRTSGAQ